MYMRKLKITIFVLSGLISVTFIWWVIQSIVKGFSFKMFSFWFFIAFCLILIGVIVLGIFKTEPNFKNEITK